MLARLIELSSRVLPVLWFPGNAAASGEAELVAFHIDAPPAKHHPFGFQSQPLFNCRIASQFDLSTRSQNPVPGQSE
jgi:hypothetical protein